MTARPRLTARRRPQLQDVTADRAFGLMCDPAATPERGHEDRATFGGHTTAETLGSPRSRISEGPYGGLLLVFLGGGVFGYYGSVLGY